MYVDAVVNEMPASGKVSKPAVSTGSTKNTVSANNTVNISEAVSDAKASVENNADNVSVFKGRNTGKNVEKNASKQTDSAAKAEEKNASDEEKIRKVLEKANAEFGNSEIKFGIHEKTDRVTIKLLDKKTKEVIKEFPPEKTLDMIAKCMEIAGILVDEKL